MKKKLLLFLAILLVFISGAAVFRFIQPKPIGKVGFSCYDMKFDYYKQMEKGMRSRLDDLGYDLIVHDQKSRTDLQIKGCMDMIEQGVEALIISPINPKVLGSIVDAAHEKKIPVILNDIGGGNSDYDVVVISDCIEGGRMAAQYLQEVFTKEGLLPQDTAVGILRNPPTHEGPFSRGDGFREVAEELGWQVFDNIGEGEEETAYGVTLSMLSQWPEIKAFFCTNDPMAIGVVRACKEMNRSDIRIIGFNGDIQALKLISQGHMLATIQQFPYAMGETGADIVDIFLSGQEIEFDVSEKKQILMPVRLIDQSNVDEARKALD